MEIDRLLDRLLNQQSATSSLPKRAELLRIAFDQGLLVRLVGWLLGDRAALLDYLEESQVHENGFIKIKLRHKPDTDFTMRFHIWDGRQFGSPAISDIHNHTRDFASVVCAGSLTVRTFSCKFGPGSYWAYRGNNRSPERAYTFESLGSGSATVTSERVLLAGDAHCAAYSRLHQTESPPKTLTATIFVQGPEKQSTTTILASERKDSESAVPRRPTLDEVVSALQGCVRS